VSSISLPIGKATEVTKILMMVRAVASDYRMRRKLMFGILVGALTMVFIGTFLIWESFVDHPLVFAIYWMVCAWLVITAALLSIYDMLQVLRSARAAKVAEKKRIFKNPS
jgi:hypothetical protein